MVSLKKYHVLCCPDCGHLRTGSSSGKTACPRCATSWNVGKGGETAGVLDSFWSIQEARASLAKHEAILSERREAARRLGTALAALKLKPGCTSEEFSAAYRARALEAHPDTNPNDATSEERMRRLNEAAECVRSIMCWQ
ncbi:MAG: DnaJ domain-containing protein [Candidatus Micrarchaeota archaeon]|nr:DnaJ domain-containing protein [Candidatus Micrarchaeota archaeon]